MQGLRDVRGRMRAITQTLQMTKAMKLISTVKLRRARRTLEESSQFFDRVRLTMSEIAADVNPGNGLSWSEFLDPRAKADPRRSAVIVITSDRGLAGSYNASIAHAAERLCASLPSPFLILVGAVGQRYFTRSPYPMLENITYKSRIPTVNDAAEIADFVVTQFQWGMFDEVRVVYTRMRSSVLLAPETIQLLPLDPSRLRQRSTPFQSEAALAEKPGFEYLPSAPDVFDAMVPLYMKGVLYGALVESYAAEQSARIAAMEEASKNAESMMLSLKLAYNRVRQGMITQEVSEIVSGATALET